MEHQRNSRVGLLTDLAHERKLSIHLQTKVDLLESTVVRLQLRIEKLQKRLRDYEKIEGVRIDKSKHPLETTVEAIQGFASYAVTRETLTSPSRKREFVEGRQISMYLLCKYTNLSCSTIGLLHGGRDHSTVLHAKQAVVNLLITDRNFAYMFNKIELRYRELIGVAKKELDY